MPLHCSLTIKDGLVVVGVAATEEAAVGKATQDILTEATENSSKNTTSRDRATLT